MRTLVIAALLLTAVACGTRSEDAGESEAPTAAPTATVDDATTGGSTASEAPTPGGLPDAGGSASASEGAPEGGAAGQGYDRPGTGTPPEVSATEEATEASGGGLATFTANGAGMEFSDRVLTFGTPADELVAAISADLGEPTSDSGDVDATQGTGCGGQLARFVEWPDLLVTMLDQSEHGEGTVHFVAWTATGGSIPVSAFVGDATEIPITIGATTVRALDASLPEGSLETQNGDPMGPTFRLTDNFGTMVGTLSAADDSGLVLSIGAGGGCGE